MTALARHSRMTLVIAILVVFVANAAAQRDISVSGPFVAKQQGITFPQQAAGFQRVDITMYTADEKNLGVGYNLTDAANPVAVTVYVYPAGRVISIGSPQNVVEGARQKLEQMEMDSVIREILNAHRGGQLITKETSSITTGGRTIRALHARVAYSEVFAGKRQALLGDVWLSAVGKWYLKDRVSYPTGNKTAAMKNVKKLMAALPIPSS